MIMISMTIIRSVKIGVERLNFCDEVAFRFAILRHVGSPSVDVYHTTPVRRRNSSEARLSRSKFRSITGELIQHYFQEQEERIGS